jgi:flagella basal body P-ring formation protein FlgA
MTAIRRLIFLTFLAMLVTAGMIVPLSASADGTTMLRLNSHILVAGEDITFGDVFEHAGEIAQTRIAAAPLPGERLALSPSRLQMMAREKGMIWTNPDGLQRVIVERASQVVPLFEISDRIADALRARGAADLLDIQFTNRNQAIHVPIGMPATVTVETIHFDTSSGQFQAQLRVPAGESRTTSIAVAGRAHALIELPVLARAVPANQEIVANDIEWVTVRQDRLQRDVITEKENLIGMAPRRVIRPGQPVRLSEIIRPIIISKGTMIRIVYEIPGMQLSTVGQALEDGAEGDTIRFRNTSSNMLVDAEVRADGSAVIRPRVTTAMR